MVWNVVNEVRGKGKREVEIVVGRGEEEVRREVEKIEGKV